MQRVPALSSVHPSLVSVLAERCVEKMPLAVPQRVPQESDRDRESMHPLVALPTGDCGAPRPRAVSGAAVMTACSRDCDGPSGAAGAKKRRR